MLLTLSLIGYILFPLTFVWGGVVESETCEPGRPNIIFMLADDAGWNDFSFHGSPQVGSVLKPDLVNSATVM